ncbi:MAG: twin-arginine translocase subunit TatC [Anaerolineae bacterium]
MATQLQPNPILPPPDPVDDGHELRMSLLEHLEELRNRLFKAAVAIVIGTAIGAIFAGDVFQYLLKPYGRPAQVLDPTGSVTNYFRVALMIGGIIAVPTITYQLMMFILPGLTRKERRTVLTALPAITLLFLVGVTFAWFLLIPPALGFLANFRSDIFTVEWTADGYLGFITSLLFWMGVAFETPLVFFVISLLGFVTTNSLIKNWRIAVVGAAVAAAMITPTVDPVNMFLVIAPLLALYLLSILLVAVGSRMNKPR